MKYWLMKNWLICTRRLCIYRI